VGGGQDDRDEVDESAGSRDEPEDHEPEDHEPDDYAAADFVPDEFDTIPPHASAETTLLYLLAAALQIGQVVVTAWGLNRLSEPAIDTQDTIVTAVIMIITLVVCLRAWSEAYHSSAEDKARERLRRGRRRP
jgi:hypothetical protein